MFKLVLIDDDAEVLAINQKYLITLTRHVMRAPL